ncbi:dehydrogenase [Nocardia panacis]|uniref:Dehydrogenase n=1 Tax=Nocardia panacis TaxID=2340916 RepID=A0A3A4JRQ8_9NOCA|nr:zinc-binding dehydrogenase [Nocardia panacis]RJO68351.1 dehydrogenase [Nocardia panacis]
MRAIVINAVGGPEVLIPAEVPTPQAGPGELVIRAEAIPVLQPETAMRSGVFPMSMELPAVFGSQAVGVVTEVGADVDPTLLGVRVATAGSGAYAEFVSAPAASIARVPQGVTPADAAAVLMSGSVALTLLDRAALRGGETVVIEAAATGVGGFLTQLAKEFGAGRIIATCGPDKATRARELGADDVIDHTDPNWPARLREILGAATADVVFDSIGGSTAADLLPAMTPVHGRMLSYGFLSGAPAQISTVDLLAGGLTSTACAGPDWLDLVAGNRGPILERLAAGGLDPMLAAELPLEAASEAHRRIEERSPLGRIVLRP